MKMNTNKRLVLQSIGLVLALAACVVFWLPFWKYTEVHGFWLFKKEAVKSLDLKPSMISGLIGLVLLGILYLRGILNFEKRWEGIVSFFVNLTLFATLIEIFISPVHSAAKHNPFLNNVFMIAACAVCLAIIIFGVKEIAKIVVLIFFFGFFYLNLKLVSDAMGIWGYVNLLVVLLSFFFQQNISAKALGEEFAYLVGGVKKQMSLSEAEVRAIVDKRVDEKLKAISAKQK